MFNWIKKWFCKPSEQQITFIHIIYELEDDIGGIGGVEMEKPKRKYVRSGKYIGKNNKSKKKGKK